MTNICFYIYINGQHSTLSLSPTHTFHRIIKHPYSSFLLLIIIKNLLSASMCQPQSSKNLPAPIDLSIIPFCLHQRVIHWWHIPAERPQQTLGPLSPQSGGFDSSAQEHCCQYFCHSPYKQKLRHREDVHTFYSMLNALLKMNGLFYINVSKHHQRPRF